MMSIQAIESDSAISVILAENVSRLRSVEPLDLRLSERSELGGGRPTFEWVEPTLLLVDESYQRDLSARSIRLIRKIVAHWDWRRFKPPVVAPVETGLEVIDGQHTAIAAATHPEIDQIPVMIVKADERVLRAAAFIGHNRDRIAITPMQMHVAAVTAGSEDALTVEQVCRKAGIILLKAPPGDGEYNSGETLAVSSITKLIDRRGAMRARQILQVLAEAECAPVSAAGIRAVEMLLLDADFAGKISSAELSQILRDLGPAAVSEAKLFAATHRIPLWRALGTVIFRRRRKNGAESKPSP
jgi:hypothetical protein